jgi:hypothetical protein
MWHGRASSAKGGTRVMLMGIRPQCPVQGGFRLFCHDNATVLNRAAAGLSQTVASTRLFYGHEAVHAGLGRRVIVFTAERRGVDG